MKPIYKVLAPDEDTSSTGTPPAADPAAAAPEAPQSAPAPAAVAAPAEQEPDWKQAFQSLYQTFEGHTKSQQEQFEALKKVMLQTFAPDALKEQSAPKYVTQEDFQRAVAQQRQYAENQRIFAQYQSELASAREKYPDLFSHPWAEAAIREAWVSPANEKAGKTAVQIAKEYTEQLDKAFLAKQAKQMQGKQVVAEQVRGTPQKSGTVPAGGANVSRLRGKDGLRAAIMGAVNGGND
jgi:hypothetical protein